MYAQAALLAAKYGKQLAIAIAICLMAFGIYLAVKSYEGLQDDLVESEMARGAQIVAHETTLASLEIKAEAAARWKASATKYQKTLRAQERIRAIAREEGDRINETLQEHDLDKLARAKPELLERMATRATHRIIGLLNCKSTASGCDGDSGAAGREPSDSVPGAARPRDFRLDSDGTWALARPRRGLFLPTASRLRSSGT